MSIAALIAAGFFSCGVERQDIKVLRDPGAARLVGPKRTTIAQLANLMRSHRGSRRGKAEHLVVEVDAFIVDMKDEQDGDLHVTLADDRGYTLIAEFPSASCTIGSRYAAQMEAARNTLLKALYAGPLQRRRAPPKLRIQGVVFFDRSHGQSGAAFNGLELHPVLRVTPLR